MRNIIQNDRVIVYRAKEKHIGFFAAFISLVGALEPYIYKGLQPYVFVEGKGGDNIWESYFEQLDVAFWDLLSEKAKKKLLRSLTTRNKCQVAKKVLLDGFKKYNIVFDPSIGIDRRPNDSMDFITNELAVGYWRKFINKNISFNVRMSEYIESVGKDIGFSLNDRIVGVLVRGTDFIGLKPYNHPIPPTIEEAIYKTKKTMHEYNCNKVFLVTEDEDILDAFKTEFKQSLLYVPQRRVKNTNKEYIEDVINNIKDENIEKQYITAIALLARCNCLLSARTSGGVAALVMSEGFEYEFFWNKGRYSVDEYSL